MIGKIVNGAFITPSPNERKKVVVVNPTDEQLKFLMGYKDVVVDEQPEISEKQYLVSVYEDSDDIIYQHWVVEDILEVPQDIE